MAVYHILIVEDQPEARNLLRSGIESLGAEFKVVDVPSGEEAMLVSSRQPVDLLVADILLAGISGLELMRKIKVSNPFLKVILVTGVEDQSVRQQVTQAGADGYFFKPVIMSEFLTTVENLLKLGKAGMHTSFLRAEKLLASAELPGLSDKIVHWQEVINALGIMVIDDNGQVLGKAGSLPASIDLLALIPDLIVTFAAGTKVSLDLCHDKSKSLLIFRGSKYDLYAAHITGSVFLMCLIGTTIQKKSSKLVQNIQEMVFDLHEIITPLTGNSIEQAEVLPDRVEEQASEGDQEVFDEILDLATKKHFKTKELKAFWDQAVEHGDSGEASGADAMTYDQARDLGLAKDV